MNKISMLNLVAQHASIRKELHGAILDAVDTAQLLPPGRKVVEFESNLASYCNRANAVGVGSGSAALQLALLAAGIGSGDEVITVPNSFYATVEAILLVGATPVFCDVELSTHLMDIQKCKRLITSRTKAILPVHLYGHLVDIHGLRNEIKKTGHKVLIIEDCAHAIGARQDGHPAPLGDIGAFSFNPTKNIGGISDAGAVVTDSDDIAERVRSLRDHGRIRKNTHELIGFNSRLSTINARVLNIKLQYLDRWNKRRNKIASKYNAAFERLESIRPLQPPNGCYSSYHQYVVCVSDRDALREYLGARGIASNIHYPALLSDQPPLANIQCSVDTARKVNGMILSIPCHPDLSDENIAQIIESVTAFDQSTMLMEA